LCCFLNKEEHGTAEWSTQIFRRWKDHGWGGVDRSELGYFERAVEDLIVVLKQ